MKTSKIWQFRIESFFSGGTSPDNSEYSIICADLRSQSCSLSEIPEVLDRRSLPVELIFDEQVILKLNLTPAIGGDPRYSYFRTSNVIPKEYERYIDSGLFGRLICRVPLGIENPTAGAIVSEWVSKAGFGMFWEQIEEQLHVLRACHEGCLALDLGLTLHHDEAVQRFRPLGLTERPSGLSNVVWSRLAVDRISRHLGSVTEGPQLYLALKRQVESLSEAANSSEDPVELPVGFASNLAFVLVEDYYRLIYRRKGEVLEIVAFSLSPDGWLRSIDSKTL